MQQASKQASKKDSTVSMYSNASVQADVEPLIQVLPNTGATISVSFYNTPPDQLASQHAIVAALLEVCPKERRGCRTVTTADLMNAASMPAAQVRNSPLPGGVGLAYTGLF